MPTQKVKDRSGEPIQTGDSVYTRYRGGKHEGEVERVVVDQAGAQEEDVKNPPKVIYKDQHGHRVAHNPSTLEKTG